MMSRLDALVGGRAMNILGCDGLPLIEAVERWGDRSLLDRVVQIERGFSAYEMAGFPGPRLVATANLRKPEPNDWLMGARDFLLLNDAWSMLDRDFKMRIERGDISITGVPIEQGKSGARTPIDGAIVSTIEFEYMTGRTILNGRTFVALRVFEGHVAEDETRAPPPGQWRLRVQDVAALDDDVILALLEEHADRCIASKDPHFIAQSKVSFMPLIVRKMEARHKDGQLAQTLMGEARALEQWIAAAARSYQTPKAASIKNHIQTRYAALKA